MAIGLILVLMEDALVPILLLVTALIFQVVLILVLMEDALVLAENYNKDAVLMS